MIILVGHQKIVFWHHDLLNDLLCQKEKYFKKETKREKLTLVTESLTFMAATVSFPCLESWYNLTWKQNKLNKTLDCGWSVYTGNRVFVVLVNPWCLKSIRKKVDPLHSFTLKTSSFNNSHFGHPNEVDGVSVQKRVWVPSGMVSGRLNPTSSSHCCFSEGGGLNS